MPPRIAVSLTLTDESDDLASAEDDCAIRVGVPTTGNFITRRLLRARRVVCNALCYLAARRTPRSLEDLLDHDIIALVRDSQL